MCVCICGLFVSVCVSMGMRLQQHTNMAPSNCNSDCIRLSTSSTGQQMLKHAFTYILLHVYVCKLAYTFMCMAKGMCPCWNKCLLSTTFRLTNATCVRLTLASAPPQRDCDITSVLPLQLAFPLGLCCLWLLTFSLLSACLQRFFACYKPNCGKTCMSFYVCCWYFSAMLILLTVSWHLLPSL